MPSANGHGEVRQDRYSLGRHRARGTERVAASPVPGAGLGVQPEPVPSSVFVFIQGAPAPPGPPAAFP